MWHRISGKGRIGMDAILQIIDFAALGVKVWGVAYAIVGIINFSEGHSQQNAAKKEEGMGKLVGGAVIFLAGLILVPMLGSMFNI